MLTAVIIHRRYAGGAEGDVNVRTVVEVRLEPPAAFLGDWPAPRQLRAAIGVEGVRAASTALLRQVDANGCDLRRSKVASKLLPPPGGGFVALLLDDF